MALIHGSSSGSNSPKSGSLVSRDTTKAYVKNLFFPVFNDFVRPAPYCTHHPILPMSLKPNDSALNFEFKYDITGSVCETTEISPQPWAYFPVIWLFFLRAGRVQWKHCFCFKFHWFPLSNDWSSIDLRKLNSRKRWVHFQVLLNIIITVLIFSE